SWPTGEISVMGAEGMVGIAARKLFGDAPPPPEVKKQIVDEIQKNIDIYKVAGWGLVDDVIDPRDTRRAIAWGLELARHKKVERPARKRRVLPGWKPDRPATRSRTHRGKTGLAKCVSRVRMVQSRLAVICE